MGIEYVLKSVAALMLIIFAANILLKKMNEIATKGAKNIKILEKMPLSRTSALYIVEIMGKYYLMSGTEQRNEILEELDEAQVACYRENQTKEHGEPNVLAEWLLILKEKVKEKVKEKRKQV